MNRLKRLTSRALLFYLPLIGMPLQELEERLKEYRFFRCH